MNERKKNQMKTIPFKSNEITYTYIFIVRKIEKNLFYVIVLIVVLLALIILLCVNQNIS